MTVVEGRFREVRVFLGYAVAVFRPGVDLPTFSSSGIDGPDAPSGATDEELKLIIEEARRQLDRQQATLHHLQNRASTLVAIAIAEVSLIASSAHKQLSSGVIPIAATVIAFVGACLALLGTATVISGKATYGVMDPRQIVEGESDLLRQTARGYLRLAPPGAATIQASITVFRDAVLLVVLAAVVYGSAYVWTNEHGAGAPPAKVRYEICQTPMHCSPNPPGPRRRQAGVPGPQGR